MSYPVVDIDPYSQSYLADPYAFHSVLRDAGPVVWIPKYEVIAFARYQEVRDALEAPQIYCSGRGVGLSDFAKEEP